MLTIPGDLLLVGAAGLGLGVGLVVGSWAVKEIRRRIDGDD